MFTEINYFYTSLKDWQKAMMFSFISYSIILFGLIVAITFILKDFKFLLVLGLSFVYMGTVIVMMFILIRIFKKRLIER
ncbi:hypothetical protein V7O61_09570 [Methanolobus sp. WCC1]|jgi:hypothetical protein|uniref:Uncharacterized protein n=1 Tax=Methanolobus tindarius DSM 2278 TaxID=1090322 RepID=W9DR06_METTI|nr:MULTISPECIES: hypothetical protein [Methanolobus]ETA69089.1 hypothetical protein MettiDRAFT_2582 [Methanolobus tindarius DSM 2278]MDK2832820.1 hypothetical protein [Methanolobus sp.]